MYKRIDVAATPEEKDVLKTLSPEQVASSTSSPGEPIIDKLTTAPGNDAPIGGLKVVAEHGWFAARPSGTEDVYKVYAEASTARSTSSGSSTRRRTSSNRR